MMGRDEKDIEYLVNYNNDTLYVKDFRNNKGKYMTTVFENNSEIQISQKIAVRITYIKDDEAIKGIKITKIKNGENDGELVLSSFDLKHLEAFLQLIKSLNLSELSSSKIKFSNDFKLDTTSKESLNSILKSEDGLSYLKEFIKDGGLSESELINLKERKNQLSKFHDMLSRVDIIRETVWQNFFEANKWILGYGLDYIFTEEVMNEKLEQITNGANFNNRGFEIDALLKTKGAINSFCLCEIKRADTPLIKRHPRSDVWSVSNELIDSVAQIQKNTMRFTRSNATQISVQDKQGNPTGENIFLIQPKAYLVIGVLSEFNTENGNNESKFSSFELFRKNIKSPEIITFDELYERAKFIVSESKNN